MSQALAGWIYRWRIPLSVFIVVGALVQAPLADITEIDNDITAWFSKDDPVYKDYERYRTEFGGTRALIIALKADSADRLFSRDDARNDRGDHRRHRARRHRSAGQQPRDGHHRRGAEERRTPTRAASRSVPCSRTSRRAIRPTSGAARSRTISSAATSSRRTASTTAIIVGFDEDRIDEVRGGVIQQIHDIVDPRLPDGVRAYYNGSLEISETYNRITLDNQRKFTPPILLFTVLAIYLSFRSWRKTLLAMFAILVSLLWTLGLYSLMGFSYNVLASMLVPLVVVLAIADDVHIMQHWDEERRRRRRRSTHSRPRSRTSRRRCSARARRRRSACCRWRRAASWPSGRSASDRRSGSWWISRSRSS